MQVRPLGIADYMDNAELVTGLLEEVVSASNGEFNLEELKEYVTHSFVTLRILLKCKQNKIGKL